MDRLFEDGVASLIYHDM